MIQPGTASSCPFLFHPLFLNTNVLAMVLLVSITDFPFVPFFS
jgi:hypothetical protein